MVSFVGIFSFLLSLLPLAISQFLPAPTDLTHTKGYMNIPVRYKEVPNDICETTPGVKSYAGYVDIEADSHIFFWFFEARNQDPTTAPLTVWLNGGPGASSMIGLLQENGPCMIDRNYEPYYNRYSWNNVSNMIYIDQPVDVGFSYTSPVPAYFSNFGDIVQLPNNTCPSYAGDTCGTYSSASLLRVTNTTDDSAESFWKVLQGFMGAFPQYSKSGFHFASESYGGHYGPVYNEYLVTQNAAIAAGKMPGAHHIQLDSVMIGNGWYNPLVQYEAYYNFTVYPGNTYDYQPFTKEIQERMYNSMYGPGNCYDQTIQCYTTGRNDICSTADDFCANEVEDLLDKYAHRDEYDIRQLKPALFPKNYFTEYLNKPKVRSAVGAFVNWFGDATQVPDAFTDTGDDDKTEMVPADLKALVESGVYFVMYNGDADYNCNWLGNQVTANSIGAPGWSSAGFENVSTLDGIVHGQVKQSDNFAFCRVYESGHEVPFYQPEIALTMFERVIKGLDVATGQKRVTKGGSYRTTGPALSTYREGNRTIQTHVLPRNDTYNHTSNLPNKPPRFSRRKGKRSKPLLMKAYGLVS